MTTHLAVSALPISDAERDVVLQAVAHVRTRRCFLLFAYVLMPTHLHILLAPGGDDTISAILRDIKLTAAKRIQATRGESRPLWQGRFFDRIIRNPKEWGKTIEYMHWNPVKDGLVQEPSGWPWSSWHAFTPAGKPQIPVDIVDLPADERTPLRW